MEDMMTTEQVAAMTVLWRRLLDSQYVHPDVPVSQITDEWLAGLIITDGIGVGVLGEIELKVCQYSDYSGSTCDRANCITLADDYGLTHYEGGVWGHGYITMHLGELPAGAWDETITDRVGALTMIIDLIAGLDEYPIIDESALFELEALLTEEAWDAWLESDVLFEIRSAFPDSDDTMAARIDSFAESGELREAFYAMGDGMYEWHYESANSATPTSAGIVRAANQIIADHFAAD